jgi:hypothetical protein
MCSTRKLVAGDAIQKADDFDRWFQAQQVISQGQGRRAWRNESQRSATRLYFGVVAVLVLVLLAVTVARSWQY